MKRKPFLQSLGAPFLWVHHRLLPRHTGIDWTVYLWLAWLGFFFVPWGLTETALSTKVATLAAIALFLPLYFRYYWAQGPERLLIIGIIVVLGCALIPFNGGGGGFLIYAGAFAGYGFRPRRAIVALAGLAILATLEYALLGFPFTQWLWAPTVTIMIGLANMWGAERHRQHCELKKSQDEVKRLAATAERERIGRDGRDQRLAGALAPHRGGARLEAGGAGGRCQGFQERDVECHAGQHNAGAGAGQTGGDGGLQGRGIGDASSENPVGSGEQGAVHGDGEFAGERREEVLQPGGRWPRGRYGCRRVPRHSPRALRRGRRRSAPQW